MPSQLERLIESLERKKNLRLLICAVDSWDEIGAPSRHARLAQIKGLISLCAIDRAWARIQDLLTSPHEVESFQLGVKLLALQGRADDACQLAERGLSAYPDDPELTEALQLSRSPRTVIDITEPGENDIESRCRAAESLLLRGEPLKGKLALERLQKDSPDFTRATDLLWALNGNYSLKGVTLSDLVSVHAPLSPLSDLTDESFESTVSGKPHPDLFDDGAGGFPSLFKNVNQPIELLRAQDEPEVTAVSIEAPQQHPHITSEDTREDTQIMHVVRTNHNPSDSESVVDTLVERPFDLNRRGPLAETEDESVIVRRTGNQSPSNTETTDTFLHLDISRERVADGASTRDEGADFIRSPTRPSEVPTQITSVPTPITPQRTSSPRPLGAVKLQKRTRSQKPRIDPRLASMPTQILEEPAFKRRHAPPWTSWIVFLVSLGLLLITIAGLMIVFQLLLTTS